MKVKDIEKELDAIRALVAEDVELARLKERDLYDRVLHYIADNAGPRLSARTSAQLSSAVLRSKSIKGLWRL